VAQSNAHARRSAELGDLALVKGGHLVELEELRLAHLASFRKVGA
jgi:hypothetical protein